MSKSVSVLFIFLTGLTGLMGWQATQIKNENLVLQGQLKNMKKQLVEQQATDDKLKAQLAQQESERLQQSKNLQGEHARLVEIYRQELDKLNQQKARLDEIKNRHRDTDISALQAQLHTNEDRIKDLEQHLKSYQADEHDLGGEADQALRNQKYQTKKDLDDANDKIKLQQIAIKGTQDQINYWNKHKHDINYSTKISENTDLIQQQRIDLQALKDQKQEIAQRGSQNVNIVKGQAGAQKEDIKATEGQIRAQIDESKVESKRLQDQIQQRQKANADLLQQIHQAEELYDIQYAKTKNAADAAK